MNVRQTALSVLTRCDRDGSYSNLALDAAIRGGNFSPADRALLTTLVYGVIERKVTLDYLIDRLSDRPAAQIDPQVRGILRLGLYQLRYLDRIPPHAAINESVSLATRKTSGFINALLRSYLRRCRELKLPQKEDGILPYLSVNYSFPEPLCARFVEIFGEERAAETARLIEAAELAHSLGIEVHAGHGIQIANLAELAAVPHLTELNIGHTLICRAIFTGLTEAVREMKTAIDGYSW